MVFLLVGSYCFENDFGNQEMVKLFSLNSSFLDSIFNKVSNHNKTLYKLKGYTEDIKGILMRVLSADFHYQLLELINILNSKQENEHVENCYRIM